MVDFVAFDIETTGLDAASDHIIEIGAALFSGGKFNKAFAILINPGCQIPAAATRIHGINDQMVAGQPDLPEALRQFAEFCDDRLLVAHNAPFDVKFLTAAIKQHRTKAPTGLILDTHTISRKAVPLAMSYRLEGLVKHFGITAVNFHRAEADAVYCGKVFVELLKATSKNGRLPALQNLINLSGGEVRFPQIASQAQQLGLL